ncbi:hypothetical protein [Cytobacillus oceanisediminis]|uniref:Acetyltransferase (GNAT) family protein n=1 Tax=Cytobacillus oceanisediminis TaxID=665099 RepID=A0A562J429_9BACI|nr:hypothetical protein [Cytobacillus oceanisediminis]TWH77887.1 hypothetical protein IQ19_05537 [Cytobacillus oceanisediminis]
MVVIRRVVLEDARAIAEVHVKSWQETYKGILGRKMCGNCFWVARYKRTY